MQRFAFSILVVYSANTLQQIQVLQILFLRILEQGMKVKLSFKEQIFGLGFESVVDFFQLLLYTLSARREVLVCVEPLDGVVNLLLGLVVRYLEVGIDLFTGIYELENCVISFVLLKFGKLRNLSLHLNNVYSLTVLFKSVKR